jgi:hypothetical protein
MVRRPMRFANTERPGKEYVSSVAHATPLRHQRRGDRTPCKASEASSPEDAAEIVIQRLIDSRV